MTEAQNNNKALILFSGGQDSTTCLAWALENFDHVEAVVFDYGQRHQVELEAAAKIAATTNVPLKTVKLDIFSQLTDNALTNHDKELTPGNEEELPSSFVPGRNLIFLSTAAIHAQQQGITNLITGVCQTDYSGYPDCRDDFVKSLETTINLAMESKIRIHTPLMFLTKAETVKMMMDLGKIGLLADSHTCYEGQRPACGKCPSCKLRLKGFEEAGVEDPVGYDGKNI
jgi:7-cyano-7-deazaguanine synthase